MALIYSLQFWCKKKKKKSPCSKCVCADSSIKKLLKSAECFKSCWKKQHFHLIVYIHGEGFTSFTDAYSCYFSRTPHRLHGTHAPLHIPLSPKNFLNSHKEIRDSNTKKLVKGTISQGWECHFWYDLSLYSSKQQLLAAAASTGKGNWSTCLFLRALRIRSLERLRELPAVSMSRNVALQLPASFAHAHKLN